MENLLAVRRLENLWLSALSENNNLTEEDKFTDFMIINRLDFGMRTLEQSMLHKARGDAEFSPIETHLCRIWGQTHNGNHSIPFPRRA